jgi:hypothetical protein
MIQISKLEGLMNRIELADAFHDCYVKMLAEAWVANDKERVKVLRVILHRQVAFVALEMVKAKKEECGREEIVQ